MVGGGSESLSVEYDQDNTMVQLAAYIQAQCVGTLENKLFINIGTNDMLIGYETEAEFATRLGLLLDTLRVRRPDLEVIVASPILTQDDTFGSWRTAIANLCATKSWVRYVDGATQLTVSAWVGGVHPTSSQYALMSRDIESILGLFCIGDLYVNATTKAYVSWLPGRDTIVNGNVRLFYDRSGRDSHPKQTALAKQVPLLGPQESLTLDGPANCAYVQNTVALAASASVALASYPGYTLVIVMRWDGATPAASHFAFDQVVVNRFSVYRTNTGSIALYCAGLQEISATTPSGWHVYEITIAPSILPEFGQAQYWRIDGSASAQNGTPPETLDSMILAARGGDTNHGSVSIAEFALVPGGDPHTDHYRVMGAYRTRLLEHIKARYGIVMAG